MNNIFYTYKWISFIISIGVPQLLYYTIKESNGFAGAPAITSTLKYLGFNIHMELGIKLLIVIGVLSFIVSEWFFIQYYVSRIEKDIIKQKLNSVLKVLCLIDSYNIPKGLKKKLKTYYL